MRPNPVKEKLARGETVFGTMVFEFVSPGLPAILAAAGADFVLYDMEHSGISEAQVREQISYARGLNLVPFVRPPAKQYGPVSRLLDLGAMGLMLPMVESREEAEEFVSWCRYPPQGVRGAMFGGAHDDFRGGDVKAKMEQAHERTFLMAMIETAQGIENAEAIMGVEGIDAAHMGQFDLSLSLGVPGDVEGPVVREAIDRMVAACERHGKVAAGMAPTVEIGRDWMQRGFRMISYSYDIGLLGNELSRGIGALRGEK